MSISFWSSKVPCLFSYSCQDQEKGGKPYLDSWVHTADFLLLREPVHEPNGTKASQNNLQSGDTQAHNSLPSILATEWYLFRLCLNTAVFLSGVLFSCQLRFSSIFFPVWSWLWNVMSVFCQQLKLGKCGGFWAATFTFGRIPVPSPVGRSPLSFFIDVIHMPSCSSSLPWKHKLTLAGSSAFLASEWTETQWLNLSSQGHHSLNLNFRLIFPLSDFFSAKLCLYVCIFVHMHVRVFMLHRHMWYVFIYVCIHCVHTWQLAVSWLSQFFLAMVRIFNSLSDSYGLRFYSPFFWPQWKTKEAKIKTGSFLTLINSLMCLFLPAGSGSSMSYRCSMPVFSTGFTDSYLRVLELDNTENRYPPSPASSGPSVFSHTHS